VSFIAKTTTTNTNKQTNIVGMLGRKYFVTVFLWEGKITLITAMFMSGDLYN